MLDAVRYHLWESGICWYYYLAWTLFPPRPAYVVLCEAEFSEMITKEPDLDSLG